MVAPVGAKEPSRAYLIKQPFVVVLSPGAMFALEARTLLDYPEFSPATAGITEAAAAVAPVANTTPSQAGGLAHTGTNVRLLVLLGMSLMAFGTGLSRVSRRENR